MIIKTLLGKGWGRF